MDFNFGLSLGQFATEPGNMSIQRVRLDLVVDAVDRFLQGRPCDRAAHTSQQCLQHKKLAAWQIEWPTGDAGFPIADVERETAKSHGFGRQVRWPAEHRAQPRQQFFDGKWLAEIVVWADVQPSNAIDQ